MTSKIRKAFDKAYAMFLDMTLILPGVQANPPRKQVVTHEHHVHVKPACSCQPSDSTAAKDTPR